jgi:hypothetical protein
MQRSNGWGYKVDFTICLAFNKLEKARIDGKFYLPENEKNLFAEVK